MVQKIGCGGNVFNWKYKCGEKSEWGVKYCKDCKMIIEGKGKRMKAQSSSNVQDKKE